MVTLTQSIFAGGIVNLSIGPDEIPFDAHIELLCAHSSFFDKALDGRFVEAETKYIPFPDEDPAIFTEFLSWAYTGQFTFKETGWMELCKLWIVGDKYQIPALQNHITALLGNKYDNNPAVSGKGNIHPTVITHVYENTPDTSPLRRTITEMAVWGMDLETLDLYRTDFPREFLEDYSLQQGRRARGLVPKMPLYLLGMPPLDMYLVTATGLPQDKVKEMKAKEKEEKVVGHEEKKGEGEGRSISNRPRKIPKSVRAASGSISPRPPSTGAGAANSSPVRTAASPRVDV